MIKEFLIYFATYLGLFVASFYILSLLENRKNSPLEIKPHSELPFVSIIVPAFNEERGIAGTIESALSIDYPKEKLEIIVVDDGSKDKTYEIASKYQSQIVKVFRMEKNSGKGAAMNLAIKKARGEFIVTMDATT
jgi:cellulose synthase/poly-beta-1,6-N-acetylglucosamine synthase-like glycosyltransferase